jgi:hypothetical protein
MNLQGPLTRALRSFRRFAPCTLLAAGLTASRTPNALAQDPSQSSGSANPKQNSKPVGTAETAAKNTAGHEERDPRENELGLRTIKNIVHDQREIWTSPARIRLGHADWLYPQDFW